MTDRPMLFSAPMVRALLDGSKTQTRRVIKPQPSRHNYLQPMFGKSPDGVAFGESYLWREVGPDYPDDDSDDRRFGVPGDRLWVRETFALLDHESAVYRADCGPEHEADLRALGRIPTPHAWKPSIHMPRWASRITLELTDVRVQRLQDISEDGARAEGAASMPNPCGFPTGVHFACCKDGDEDGHSARDKFRHLWDGINGKRPGCSWEANPWVWALTFKVVQP